MTYRRAIFAAATLAYLALVLAANYATTNLGLIPVGFGLVATAGTYFAGLTFVVRDTIEDTGGTAAVVIAIVVAAALSFLIAAPVIALASGVAFLVAELLDLAVYRPLRARGYLRAAVASNVVGSVADTFLFLAIAGFPLSGSVVAGQLVAKLTVTVVLVVAVAGARRRRPAK